MRLPIKAPDDIGDRNQRTGNDFLTHAISRLLT
jgi:hypothetical protein